MASVGSAQVLGPDGGRTGRLGSIGVRFLIDGDESGGGFAGSASVGLSFVYAKRFLSDLDIPSAALTAYQMGLAVVTLLIATDLNGVTAILSDTRAATALVVGLGLLGTGVAYILYYYIVAALGAVTASSVTFLPPIVALAIGFFLVGEPVTWVDAAAVMLILLGVVALRRRSPAANGQ